MEGEKDRWNQLIVFLEDFIDRRFNLMKLFSLELWTETKFLEPTFVQSTDYDDDNDDFNLIIRFSNNNFIKKSQFLKKKPFK